VSALTAKERQTLNNAMDIILARTPPKASWSFGANYWHGSRSIGVCTYFSAQGEQHTFLDGETFADIIGDGLAIQVHEDANADEMAAKRKAARIEQLRRELDELTEVPA